MCKRCRGAVDASAKSSLSAMPRRQVISGCVSCDIGGWSEGYADL
jgi:hypothetical protein